MTHDELLMRLWEKRNALCNNLDVHFALSAVVELHKPKPEPKDSPFKDSCNGCSKTYPCKTIQAIEEQLK